MLQYLKSRIRSADGGFEKLTFHMSFCCCLFLFLGLDCDKPICKYSVSCTRAWGQLRDIQVTFMRRKFSSWYALFILQWKWISENHSGQLTNVYWYRGDALRESFSDDWLCIFVGGNKDTGNTWDFLLSLGYYTSLVITMRIATTHAISACLWYG